MTPDKADTAPSGSTVAASERDETLPHNVHEAAVERLAAYLLAHRQRTYPGSESDAVTDARGFLDPAFTDCRIVAKRQRDADVKGLRDITEVPDCFSASADWLATQPLVTEAARR